MRWTTTRDVESAVNCHTEEIIKLRTANKELENKIDSLAAALNLKFDRVLGPNKDVATWVWHWDAKRMCDKKTEEDEDFSTEGIR